MEVGGASVSVIRDKASEESGVSKIRIYCKNVKLPKG